VYNIAKETKDDCYKKGVSLSNYDLQKQLTGCKRDFEWIGNVGVHSLQAVLDRLDNSYKNYFRNLKNGEIQKGKAKYIAKKQKNGGIISEHRLRNFGKPKWAKKDEWVSIPFKSIKQTEKGFKLPKFGEVKVFNNKPIKGNLKTATLIKEADGLYIKITVEEQETATNRENQSVCAVDMGISYFYVSSDGEYVANPKHLFNHLKKLRIENRSLARKTKDSSSWKKQKSILCKTYQKVKRVRMDFLHKKSTLLSNKIVIREDLNVKEMSQDKKYAKHILDCAWGTFFNLLDYKTNIIKVEAAYSSQECSVCGNTCKENRKTQSLFECTSCGYTENADYQAALNLLKRGHSLLEANVSHKTMRFPRIPLL